MLSAYTITQVNNQKTVIKATSKQFKQNFPNTRTEIWSVGTLGWFGQYVLIDMNGVHFHNLPVS